VWNKINKRALFSSTRASGWASWFTDS
jgi:hypothetical protein